MKKIPLLYVPLLICFVAPAQVQTEFGIKLGGSSSNIQYDFAEFTLTEDIVVDVDGNDVILASAGDEFDIKSRSTSRTTLHGGVYMLLRFGKFGVQPEVLFSKKSTDLEFTLLGEVEPERELELTYLSIPVLFNYYISDQFCLQLGPQFANLRKAYFDDEDLIDFIGRSDFGGVIGLQWEPALGVRAGARFEQSFRKIDIFTDSDPLDHSIKNRTFQLYVGYSLFKLGK